MDQSRRARRRSPGQRVHVQPRRGRAAGAQAAGEAERGGHAGHAGPEAGHGRGQFRQERGAERHTRSGRVGEEEQRGLRGPQADGRDREKLAQQKDQHRQLVPRLRA